MKKQTNTRNNNNDAKKNGDGVVLMFAAFGPPPPPQPQAEEIPEGFSRDTNERIVNILKLEAAVHSVRNMVAIVLACYYNDWD